MITVATFLFLVGILVLHVRSFRKSYSEIPSGTLPDGISIVIPFRNEAHNLFALLQSLSKQCVEIPFEIILVNDSSSDQFKSVIASVQEKSPHLVIHTVENQFDQLKKLTSKQQAIDTGVSSSQYEMIVFTDADMIFDSHWLSSLLHHFDSEQRPFIFGRTAIIDSRSLFRWIQRIQLDFLFSTAHLFAKAGIDSSCMGNNIAISKNLYAKIGGQEGIGYSIVEDKKLLSSVKSLGIIPISVEPFIPQAFTYAVDSPATFLHQMIRWFRGGALESIQIAGIATILGCELFAVFICVFGNPSEILMISTISGVIASYILYIREFYKIGPIRMGYLYPLILVILAIESLILLPALIFVSPRWKGRNLSVPKDHSC